MPQPSQTLRLTAGAQKRPDNARRGTSGRGRLSGDESALNWRMQHHPLGEDQPGLARIKIAGPEGGTPSSYPPSSYPVRAADTVDALEKKAASTIGPPPPPASSRRLFNGPAYRAWRTGTSGRCPAPTMAAAANRTASCIPATMSGQPWRPWAGSALPAPISCGTSLAWA